MADQDLSSRGLTLPKEGIYSDIKVENDKVSVNKEETETKNLAEAELIAMKAKSQMEQEHTMAIGELGLKHNAETHENEMHYYVIDVSDVSTNKVLIKDRPHRFGVIIAQVSKFHLPLFCVFYCFSFFYFCIFPTLL